MKTFFLSIAIFLMGISSMVAQEKDATELSLKGCVQTAVEKNINTRIARINYEKSEYAVSESFAALLPSIGISGSFRDNVKLPTTLLPGEIFGSPGTSIAVQMGRQFNTNAAININQILYSKTALTALKISKEMVGAECFERRKKQVNNWQVKYQSSISCPLLLRNKKHWLKKIFNEQNDKGILLNYWWIMVSA